MVIGRTTIQVIGEKCAKAFGAGMFEICNFDSFFKYMVHKILFFPEVSNFLSVWIDLMIVAFDWLLLKLYKSRYGIVCISSYFFIFLTVINFWDISCRAGSGELIVLDDWAVSKMTRENLFQFLHFFTPARREGNGWHGNGYLFFYRAASIFFGNVLGVTKRKNAI